MLLVPENEIAECVGLWLAEGDRKTSAEITFTNNCFGLIAIFHERVNRIFPDSKFRLYTYLPDENESYENIPNVEQKVYFDKRASMPYYIIRTSSVGNVKLWKSLVERISNEEGCYPDILRGFFAGEGNLKSGLRNKVLRIAQKSQIKIVDDILDYLKIDFTFSESERAYVICKRYNWDKLAKIRVADMHPEKKKKFWDIYDSFKEYHYKKNYIMEKILNFLDEPRTSRELAKEFSRCTSRVQQILMNLKKKGVIRNYRVRSRDYWIKEGNHVIISKRKAEILSFLDKPRKTSHIARKLEINWKAAFKRMRELDRLELVEKRDDMWSKRLTEKEVIVL
jgi:hypothetical protein